MVWKNRRKVIYHSETETTKTGRAFKALLSFLTLNRYSIIFTLKITLVKRYYDRNPFERRGLRDLYTALVILPIVLGWCIIAEKCSSDTQTVEEIQSVDNCGAPSVAVPSTIARPHTHL